MLYKGSMQHHFFRSSSVSKLNMLTYCVAPILIISELCIGTVNAKLQAAWVVWLVARKYHGQVSAF